MLDEDVVNKGLRNSNERFLVVNVLIMVLLPAVCLGGTSSAIIGLFCALGIIAPINTLNYIYSWSTSLKKPVSAYVLAVAPFVAAIFITVAASFNNVLIPVETGTGAFYSLDATPTNSPVLASDGMLNPLLSDFTALAAVLCGLSVYFITDSRFVIRKIICWTAFLSAMLMLLGCFLSFMLNFKGTFFYETKSPYFSTFADASQWATFALVWLGGALAMAVYSPQKFRRLSFFYSMKFWSLFTAGVLWCGIMFAGKPLHCLLANAVCAVACAFIAGDLAPLKFNARRHEMLRHITSHSKRLEKLVPWFLSYAAAAVVFALVAVYVGCKINGDRRLLLAENSASAPIAYAEKSALWEDTAKMVKSHLLFGYGSASFAPAFAFYQGSDIGSSPWSTPHSDLLHKVAENGVVGLALSCITFAGFLLVWLFRHSFSLSGLVMLATLLSVAAVSVFESPLQSPAVLVSFWVLAMAFFRWDNAAVG